MAGRLRRTYILVTILWICVSYAASFVAIPSTVRLGRSCCTSHRRATAGANIAPALGSAPRYLAFRRLERKLRSSPSEIPEENEMDAVQREAQELDQMIRRSRGVVMEAIEQEWREAMELALEEEGARLCAAAYKGFESRGRGCMFVNVDMSLSSNKASLGRGERHAVYRTLEEVVMERSSRVQSSDQMQIIQRCQQYDPEAGFVLVFGHKGLLGVQVVQPSRPPGEVLRSQRGGSGDERRR